jgi:hypothetical protein
VTTPDLHRDARSAHLISAGAQALIENAKRFGLQWGMSAATVQQVPTSDGFVLVIFDGDSVPVQAMSLVGNLRPGFRVMVMSVPPSANYIIGLFKQIFGIVGYGSRTTNTSTTTTVEIGVLSLSGVPIIEGIAYHIYTSDIIMDSSVANDAMTVALRYTDDGTSPTTSSVLLTSMEHVLGGSAAQAKAPMSRTFIATDTFPMNILMTIVRTVGTGNVSLNAITGMPIDITVEAIGVAVADTGAAL